MSKVVTANTLATGIVVFLGMDGGWTHAIADARVFPNADAAEDGLAAAKQDEVRALIVDPFVTDRGPDANGRPAMTLRDTIRAFGPTIRFRPTDQVSATDPAARG